jgi:hypothetical protein
LHEGETGKVAAQPPPLHIHYDNKLISEVTCTRFLGLTVKCTLTWTNHTDMLTKKVSNTRFLIQNLKSHLSLFALKKVYHSLFHSVMSYSIIFGGNSPHSPVIFKMQKRVIRMLMRSRYTDSCRGLFKELKILTLASQYIFYLVLFVVFNKRYFASKSAFHNFNTRHKIDLHLPQVSLTKYQNGVFYTGIKVFSVLPRPIKHISSSPEKFKVALKHYLLAHSFYTVDELLIEQNI